MSADSTGARKKLAHMLVVCVALSTVGVLTFATSSFGSNRQSPQIVTRAVTFDIPASNPPRITWILKLFNRGALVGSDAGTAGVLIVPVPRTVNGSVQADVFRNGHWFSGSRMQMPDRGRGGTGTGTGGKGTGGKGTGGKGSRGGGHGKKNTTPPADQGAGGFGGAGTGGSIGSNGTGYGSTGNGGFTATGGSTTNAGSTGAGATTSGSAGGTGSAGHSATGAGGSATHGPSIVAAYASDPEASSQLAFAGVGNGFWSTSMGGLGLVLLGAYFVVRRRPRTTATPSYRSLVKDF